MRKTHSPEQIIDILRQIERETNQGKTAASWTKRHPKGACPLKRAARSASANGAFTGGVNGRMEKSDAKQLRELEKENARLKKLLAEKDLDLDILKEASKGKW